MDELKKLLAAMGAGPAVAAIVAAEQEHARQLADARAAADEAQRQTGVHAERLKQAMAREAAATADRDRLAAENASLKAEMGRMSSHPEVRAAMRAKLVAQSAAIAQQLAALADPAPAPTDAPKGN